MEPARYSWRRLQVYVRRAANLFDRDISPHFAAVGISAPHNQIEAEFTERDRQAEQRLRNEIPAAALRIVINPRADDAELRVGPSSGENRPSATDERPAASGVGVPIGLIAAAFALAALVGVIAATLALRARLAHNRG